MSVRGAQKGNLGPHARQADDAVRPLDRHPPLQLQAELGEVRDRRVEVLDDDADVVHAQNRRAASLIN